MDTMKTVQDIANKIDIEAGHTMRSISSQASKAIYYFPILCYDSIQPKTMSMISKNLESVYMSFIKACFALTPAISVKGKVLNIEDYLKTFHQNVGIQSKNDFFLSFKLNESAGDWNMFVNEPLNEAISIRKAAEVIRDNSSYNKDNAKRTTKPKSISVTDVKKENSMTPSITNVTVTFLFNGQDIDTKIPVGVKTIIHAVDPEEMNEQIMDIVAGRGMLHNIIRYTTGELLSLKDILFGTSKMKKNIVNKNNSDVIKWADMLEHRKRLAKLSLPFFGKKSFLPNLTIVMTMEDVENIQRLIGYNLLTDTHRASKFIKDSFLLGLVICDEATETAYIMYDGHSNYEEYPYSSLKRENEKVNDEINAMIKGLGMGVRLS